MCSFSLGDSSAELPHSPVLFSFFLPKILPYILTDDRDCSVKAEHTVAKNCIHTTLLGYIFPMSCCSGMHENLSCETTVSPCSCPKCQKRPDDATLTAACA